MEVGSTSGYFTIRMKSDVIYEHQYNGAMTRERFCIEPGTFCGLVMLMDVNNGEPLAFINDGVLQQMRVGGDGGSGVKFAARENAEVVGMLGSGGQARTDVSQITYLERGNLQGISSGLSLEKFTRR